MTDRDNMTPADAALEAAMDWYEGKRSKAGNVNTNVMCVGLAIAELLKNDFPLTEDIVRTDEGSQVRGLSGSMVSRVLKEYGEEQEFTSEGGRTSRGSLPMTQELAVLLNGLFDGGLTDEDRADVARTLQGYFVRRIQTDYFAKQRMKVEIDPRKPVSAIVADILQAARNRSDQPTGTVAQHLVGAKLELRFPDADVGRDKANAADQQTNRQGDFQLGNTAFHVTMSPMPKLVARAQENIREGYRPVMLVPYDKVQFATGLFESEGLSQRVGVQSIESFVGTNIEEMGGFESDDIRTGIAHLVRRYNERIYACETDKSLMVVEPEWLTEIVGEWHEALFDYAYIALGEQTKSAMQCRKDC